MSEERARARRMRLSELHARANKWQEEAEAEVETDPAAEFERTGRLPEDAGGIAETIPPFVYQSSMEQLCGKYAGLALAITFPVALFCAYAAVGPVIWLINESVSGKRDLLSFGTVFLLGMGFIFGSLAWIWLGLFCEHKNIALDQVIKRHRRELVFLVVAIVGIGGSFLGWRLFKYVHSAERWNDFLWRLSWALEVAVIISALAVVVTAILDKKSFSLRRSLELGIAAFAIAAIAFPLIMSFGIDLRYAADTGEAEYLAIAFAYLIGGGAVGWGAFASFEKRYAAPDTNPPINFAALARKVWRNRPSAEAKPPSPPPPQQPQFSFQPERVIDLKPQRQRRMPNLLFSTSRRHAAVIWCGRCAGAIVLTYLLAIRFNVIRDDASVPKGMEAYYYGAIAGMILFSIGFLFFWRASKGRFDGGLTGRAIGEVLIAAAIFVAGGQLFPYQPMAAEIIQMVAIFMVVAGSAKFLRLPWLPWKR